VKRGDLPLPAEAPRSPVQAEKFRRHPSAAPFVHAAVVHAAAAAMSARRNHGSGRSLCSLKNLHAWRILFISISDAVRFFWHPSDKKFELYQAI
jgi:hypothetical protein